MLLRMIFLSTLVAGALISRGAEAGGIDAIHGKEFHSAVAVSFQKLLITKFSQRTEMRTSIRF